MKRKPAWDIEVSGNHVPIAPQAHLLVAITDDLGRTRCVFGRHHVLDKAGGTPTGEYRWYLQSRPQRKSQRDVMARDGYTPSDYRHHQPSTPIVNGGKTLNLPGLSLHVEKVLAVLDRWVEAAESTPDFSTDTPIPISIDQLRRAAR